MPSHAEHRQTALAWLALKARHVEMKKKNTGHTLATTLMHMNKVYCAKASSEQGRKVVQLPNLEVDDDGNVYDYVAKPINADQLEKMRKRKPTKYEDKEVFELKCETGLTLTKNYSSTAKRGRETAEFQENILNASTKTQQKLRDEGWRPILDGSKGGKGFKNHGHLSNETINCSLVADIQKCFAPEGSSDEVTLDGQVQGVCHFLDVIHERGEVCHRARTPHPPAVRIFEIDLPLTRARLRFGQLPESIEELYEFAGAHNEEHVDHLVCLMGRTLDPTSVDATFDLEGFVTKQSATDGVTEIGMCLGSLGSATQPRPALDVRGGRLAGRRVTLSAEQLESVANELAKQKTLLHHAGKDHLFLRAVCEDYDLPMPETIDVFRSICLGVGRRANGQRRVGLEGKDAVKFGMESLAYIFKLGEHSHIGVQDACKQHVAWRPILIALRMHYYGR